MKIIAHLAGAALAAAVGLAAPAARAADAPLLGFSVDGYASPTWDRSVTNMQTGQPHQPSRSALGLATLLNVDELAFGAVLDGMPGMFGDGRVSMGGVFGWQPRWGHERYQVLGEVGEERFMDTGGNLFNTPSVAETTLGYVGARLGVTHTFGSQSPFELGVWAFVRKDVGEAIVTNTSSNFLGGEDTYTQYRLGGYSGGISLRVGLRFDQKRPFPGPSAQVAEPAKG